VNDPHFSRTLKRNCSMSPAGLAMVFAALARAEFAAELEQMLIRRTTT